MSKAKPVPESLPPSERIRRARETLGWSKTRLGTAIGVSGARVAAIESGRYRPTDATILRIAIALEVSPFKLAADYRGETVSFDVPASELELVLDGSAAGDQDYRRWIPAGAQDEELARQVGLGYAMPLGEMLERAAKAKVSVRFRGDIPPRA